MGGRWKFVLLCISLFGDLVFGSMFPNTIPNSTPPPAFVTTQQEVVWPLKHLATPAEVTAVKEEKTDDRGLHMEQAAQEKNWESGQPAAEVLPKVIVINNEQKPVSGVLIHNTTQDGDKKLPLTSK